MWLSKLRIVYNGAKMKLEDSMNLRDKFFIELQRQNFAAGHMWTKKKNIDFVSLKLNPLEKKEYPNLLKELCDEGFFTSSDFRLTEKGEEILWSTEY